MDRNRLFTDEQVEFIKTVVVGRPRIESLQLVNEKFDLEIKPQQWFTWMKNHKLKSGNDARFKPGQEPPNKGMKGVGGWEPTQFKKGNRPANYMPVGSERVNSDGYVDIKIADPNKWRAKHVLMYEEAHGPVPKGHVLIFLDQNKLNVTMENIRLITRRQLVIMNQKGFFTDNAEGTKSGLIMADIIAKIVDNEKALKLKRSIQRKNVRGGR